MIGIGLGSSPYLPLPPRRFQAPIARSSCCFLLTCSNGYKVNQIKLYHLALLNNRSFFIPIRRRTPKRTSISVSDTTSDASSLELQPNQDDAQRKVPDVQTLARRFWKVAAPYWFSDDKVGARWRLAAVFALTLGTTGISVLFNFLGRDFYNALANKDQEQFTKQLLYYMAAFATGIPIHSAEAWMLWKRN